MDDLTLCAPSAAQGSRPFGHRTPKYGDPDIIALPELIRETIPMSCVGFLGGQSGAMKSFMSLHLGLCIVTGEPFAGRTVETTGGVVFVIAEGEGSIDRRLKAARRQFRIERDIPIEVVSDFGAIDSDDAFRSLEARLREIDADFRKRFSVRLRAAFIDTVQAAGMIGVDRENDPATWSRLFQHLRGIAKRIGVTIILIHHFGKSATAGLRGSSDTRASADFVLALTCDRDEVTGETKDRFLALSKHRDGCEGPIGQVVPTVVEVGQRDDGSPITTLTAEVNTDKRLVRSERKQRKNGALTAFEAALREAMLNKAQNVLIDGDAYAPTVRAVRLSDVFFEFEGFYVTSVEDEKKRAATITKQFRNALERARQDRLCIAKRWANEDWVWYDSVREHDAAVL